MTEQLIRSIEIEGVDYPIHPKVGQLISDLTEQVVNLTCKLVPKELVLEALRDEVRKS